MTATRMLAVGVALLSGTALAQAQTVISREITNEPVETLITRGPEGITVTRRPLQTMAPPVVSTVPVFPTWGPSGEAYGQGWAPAPGWTPGYAPPPAYAAPPPPAGGVMVRPYAEPAPPEAAAPRTVVIEESVDDPVPPVRTVRRGTPPIMARAVEPEPTRTARTRTATRRVTSEPMALAPTQRSVIYRTLGQQSSYDPATLERVTPTYAQQTYAQPSWGQSWGTGWQPGYAGYAAAPAPRTVTYTVGSVVPETVALAPVPRRIVAQVPQTRGYQYTVVNGRVLLVEPASGTVVADVVR
ncbi:DUF1236 domain-containing protein [Rhodoplanes sp. TEM]|uniref:DUF1236 domain-containing protein n=1 Tax=Rhodoplanes tepidamans TaxID=200616 RepID=A0ABT5JAD9_RHOTP|nr:MULTISPECIES: DUF1236 domain-containing protein [Rhodoplanes]MDC7786351.1 DUF1236 domain-containing protein [Rhodoplanes tepidamans]MDC7984690.1 DUF1236 domain-containing protein [Rhodoplanes sp. TEM]MDQ0354095.1 hypothetical protein [Rhodoplanes tepidamans]